VFLADLTWEEVGSYLKKRDDLMVPIGICEQHAKHLPLNTDILVAEYISNYLSEETKTLVAPTFNYGVGLPCDRFYPGSSSIQYEDLRSMISSLLDWWRLQGFKRFFLVSAHGDPFHMKALMETKCENVHVLQPYDIDLSQILEKQQVALHACEAETSVMLYLFPEKVRKERIENFEMPFDEFENYLNHSKSDPIPNSPGCLGYPSFATIEKGRKIVERMKTNALSWIKSELKGRPKLNGCPSSLPVS
jgi:creatinine amidohydrolase